MSTAVVKMGPEEEFELHNRQNSWPILFEVFCFHGSVIPAGTLLYPQDARDCNVRWRTTNKQSELYMMPLPITAERLSAGDATGDLCDDFLVSIVAC